jgi:hypothetical protein
MDHLWASSQLRVFVFKIDQLARLVNSELIEQRADRQTGGPTAENVADELVSLDPVMRDIMNAARPGYGDYAGADSSLTSDHSASYWTGVAKPWALRAIGVHTLGAEAREKLRPDSPDLVADQLHSWVWDVQHPCGRQVAGKPLSLPQRSRLMLACNRR